LFDYYIICVFTATSHTPDVLLASQSNITLLTRIVAGRGARQNLAPMRFTQMKGVPLGADEGLYCRTPRNRHSRNPEKRLFQEENEPHDQIRTSNIPKNTKIVTGYVWGV
jgi:hypothetical protein